jgi:DNA-binding MarR family transcriptional regulator
MAVSEPDHRTNVLFDVWLVSRAATALLDEALEPSGLTADEFAVYSVLRRAPLTPTALARWMAAPLTTVSSYIKRFETRGHVARVANPGDGRSYQVALTEQGVRAHADAGARFLPVLHRVEQSLGPASSVQDALAALRHALDLARSMSVADR